MFTRVKGLYRNVIFGSRNKKYNVRTNNKITINEMAGMFGINT